MHEEECVIVVLFYNKSSVCQPSSVLGPEHSHVCVHLGTLWHYITQGFLFSHKIWLIFNYISKTYNILVVFFHHSHASALSYVYCICLCNPNSNQTPGSSYFFRVVFKSHLKRTNSLSSKQKQKIAI